MTIVQASHDLYNSNRARENGDSFEDRSISCHSVDLPLDIRVAPYAHKSPGLVIRPASRLYLIDSPCAQVSINWFTDVQNRK